LTLRVGDPPHFDPYLVIAFKTQVVYSFAHSRLLKHKAGPASWPQAGYARGFSTVVDFHSFGETAFVDGAQLVAKDLKEIGVEAKLNQRECGAYIATVPLGKYEGIVWGPSTPFLDQDTFLANAFLPESPRNNMKVNDPPLTDGLSRRGLLGGLSRGMGSSPQELRAEPRLRLRRPPDGRLARPLSPSGKKAPSSLHRM